MPCSNRLASSLAYYLVCLASLLIIGAFAVPSSPLANANSVPPEATNTNAKNGISPKSSKKHETALEEDDAAAAAANTNDSYISNKEDYPSCLSYGCPMYPTDIVNDISTRDALLALRAFEAKADNDDNDESETTTKSQPEERGQLFQQLSPYGDKDKTVLFYKGDKGNPNDPNQDAAVIVSPYLIGNHTDGVLLMAQFSGVFDGHGYLGEVVSKFARDQIPLRLSEKLSRMSLEDVTTNHEAVKTAIKDTFIEVDQDLPTNGQGGATATMILQLNSKLYIANTGDSRSFIALQVDDHIQMVYESKEHKPGDPLETARILKAGGHVHQPKGDVPRAYAVDKNDYLTFGVAMSRSLGDWQAKGVIPDPTVDIVDIDQLIATAQEKFVKECITEQQHSDKSDSTDENKKEDVDVACLGEASLDASEVHILAISATDGMADYLQLEQIAYVFAASMFVPENPHPLTAAEYLILMAAEYWQQEYQGKYRDDIAVAAVKVLRRPTHPANDDDDDDEANDNAKTSTTIKETVESSSESSTTKKTSNAKKADEKTQWGEQMKLYFADVKTQRGEEL
jgi:serine/threonine protein phosphatase PrpC